MPSNQEDIVMNSCSDINSPKHNDKSSSGNGGNNVIRKLGGIETYFQNQIEMGSSINVSTIIFESCFDLFSNIELVNQAVNLWKQTQPLLRSKVEHHYQQQQKQNDEEKQPEKYFVFADDNVIKNMDNVKYLYFDNNNKNKSMQQPPSPSSSNYDECKDYWKFLVEHEMTVPIDWQNGLMWRLTFVHLNQTELHRYNYALLISVSHAIFDGASAFFTLNQLFHFIERLFTNTLEPTAQVNEANIAKSVEEHANDFVKQNNLPVAASRLKIDRFKKPKPLIIADDNDDDHRRTVYYPVDDLSENDLAKGVFKYATTNGDYMTLAQLTELSKTSVTKFYFKTFDDQKFKQFLLKCKSKNAKITGVFNLIFIMAWRHVYKHFKLDRSHQVMEELDKLHLNDGGRGADPTADYNHKINYLTIVNLRAFLRHVDFSSLVWLCNSLHSTYEHELNEEETNFWEEKFWQMARNESDEFHGRLRSGEQFKFDEQQPTADSVMSAEEIEKYLRESTLIHYGLSNLQVPIQLTKLNKHIQIKQMFTLTSYRQDWTHDFSYNNIISLGPDEIMFWSLSYNSYFVKNETIEVFQRKALEIYDRLSSN